MLLFLQIVSRPRPCATKKKKEKNFEHLAHPVVKFLGHSVIHARTELNVGKGMRGNVSTKAQYWLVENMWCQHDPHDCTWILLPTEVR